MSTKLYLSPYHSRFLLFLRDGKWRMGRWLSQQSTYFTNVRTYVHFPDLGQNLGTAANVHAHLEFCVCAHARACARACIHTHTIIQTIFVTFLSLVLLDDFFCQSS